MKDLSRPYSINLFIERGSLSSIKDFVKKEESLDSSFIWTPFYQKCIRAALSSKRESLFDFLFSYLYEKQKGAPVSTLFLNNLTTNQKLAYCLRLFNIASRLLTAGAELQAIPRHCVVESLFGRVIKTQLFYGLKFVDFAFFAREGVDFEKLHTNPKFLFNFQRLTIREQEEYFKGLIKHLSEKYSIEYCLTSSINELRSAAKQIVTSLETLKSHEV